MSKTINECEFKILSDVEFIADLLEDKKDIEVEIVTHSNKQFKMKDGSTLKLRKNYPDTEPGCVQVFLEPESYEIITKTKDEKSDSSITVKREVSELITKAEFERHEKLMESTETKCVEYHAVKTRYHVSDNITFDVCDITGLGKFEGVDLPQYIEFEIQLKDDEMISEKQIIKTLEITLGGKESLKAAGIDLEKLYITERGIAKMLTDYRDFLNEKGGRLKKYLKK